MSNECYSKAYPGSECCAKDFSPSEIKRKLRSSMSKMATRGVNGATAASLNERFIKCAGCKVNIPKDDMLALGKCTVCGRVYEAEPVGDAVIIETVAFAAASEASTTASAASASGLVSTKPQEKPKRKRWATLTSKRGRTYYHNTETGEDTWEKPADFDADAAADDGFVPFKHDAVKNAVLREQAKIDATKMGLPAEVIATMQQRQAEEQGEDPLDSMLKRPAQNKAPGSARAPGTSSLPPRVDASHDTSSHFNGSNAHQTHPNQNIDASDSDDDADRSVASTARTDGSSPKQGSCILM